MKVLFQSKPVKETVTRGKHKGKVSTSTCGIAIDNRCMNLFVKTNKNPILGTKFYSSFEQMLPIFITGEVEGAAVGRLIVWDYPQDAKTVLKALNEILAKQTGKSPARLLTVGTVKEQGAILDKHYGTAFNKEAGACEAFYKKLTLPEAK